jgi:cytochrome c-type biogenesis protein CcmH
MTRNLVTTFAVALILSVSGVAVAKEATPMAKDPVIEERVMELSSELRCLVCQNQTLAGSDADLAKDFRQQIRTMMQQGKTDQEIRDFLVERYGDFILYKPPFNAATAILWIGPAALMVGGAAALIVTLRRRRSTGAEDENTPSPEQLARARKLLDEDGNDG